VKHTKRLSEIKEHGSQVLTHKERIFHLNFGDLGTMLISARKEEDHLPAKIAKLN
jgi:hypothetical protein